MANMRDVLNAALGTAQAGLNLYIQQQAPIIEARRQSTYFQARTAIERGMYDFAQEIQRDPDYGSYGQRWSKTAKTMYSNIVNKVEDPVVRSRLEGEFLQMAEQQRQSVLDFAYKREVADMTAQLNGELQSYLELPGDPKRILQKGIQRIDAAYQSGLVDRAGAQKRVQAFESSLQFREVANAVYDTFNEHGAYAALQELNDPELPVNDDQREKLRGRINTAIRQREDQMERLDRQADEEFYEIYKQGADPGRLLELLRSDRFSRRMQRSTSMTWENALSKIGDEETRRAVEGDEIETDPAWERTFSQDYQDPLTTNDEIVNMLADAFADQKVSTERFNYWHRQLEGRDKVVNLAGVEEALRVIEDATTGDEPVLTPAQARQKKDRLRELILEGKVGKDGKMLEEGWRPDEIVQVAQNLVADDVSLKLRGFFGGLRPFWETLGQVQSGALLGEKENYELREFHNVMRQKAQQFTGLPSEQLNEVAVDTGELVFFDKAGSRYLKLDAETQGFVEWDPTAAYGDGAWVPAEQPDGDDTAGATVAAKPTRGGGESPLRVSPEQLAETGRARARDYVGTTAKPEDGGDTELATQRIAEYLRQVPAHARREPGIGMRLGRIAEETGVPLEQLQQLYQELNQ